jgi:thymidylate kinase
VIIILEGPDGSGKTTLAKHLSNELDWVEVHHSVPTGDAYRMFMHTLLTRTSLVCDRLHISEGVYGPIMRDQDLLGDEAFKLIERFLLDWRKPLMIRCYPSLEVCLSTWKGRTLEEYVQKEEAFVRVHGAYADAFKLSKLPVLDYDYTKDTMTSILEKVRAHFRI